jgi:flagellar basal body-associated protein FliL
LKFDCRNPWAPCDIPAEMRKITIGERMAEAAAAPVEGEKKKKSKKPMLIALVVMLAAGGFFGVKMGGGSKKVEPKIELGEVMPLGEFLVNLSDGHTFLKAEISVQIAKGKKIAEGESKGEGKAEPPAPVRDAVIAVLSAQDLKTISTPEGKIALKRELAEAINDVAPKEEGKDGAKDESKDKDKDKAAKGKDGAKEKEEVVDASWDSQKGPVLKVYFTNFATQE